MQFKNPTPVAVALVPYQGKLLGVKRSIAPRIGQIALPGGYINSGETFCQALSRELVEETGVLIAESAWRVFHIGDSLVSDVILIFGICDPIVEFSVGYTSEEASEVCLIGKNLPLAFPLHEEARNLFYQRIDSALN